MTSTCSRTNYYSITERLNELGKPIEEVEIVVDRVPQVPASQNNLGPSELLKLQLPMVNQLIRVQILGEVLDLITLESNEISKNACQVLIYFCKM